MTGWTLAKYVLALAGVAIVLLADRIHHPRLGYLGLGLILAAFLLRFLQRAKAPSRNDSTPES